MRCAVHYHAIHCRDRMTLIFIGTTHSPSHLWCQLMCCACFLFVKGYGIGLVPALLCKSAGPRLAAPLGGAFIQLGRAHA